MMHRKIIAHSRHVSKQYLLSGLVFPRKEFRIADLKYLKINEMRFSIDYIFCFGFY
jgi:hypothetical protein